MSTSQHAQFEIPSGLPDIVSLATQLWGKPTKRTPDKILFGAHGSKCVHPAPVNTWFDHEANTGGGYCALYKLKHGKMPDPPGFPIPPRMAKELGNPVAWWDYHDAAGQPIARVARFHPPGQDKTYRQCRPDGSTWRWKMQGLQIPLYHLPELLNAPDGSTVLITEGEKCVDQLRLWGTVATTSAGGAKKFRSDHATALARFACIIVPDNDEAGRKHRDVVASALHAAGCTSIRVLNLPNLPDKGDVIDWVRAGGTASVFAELVAQAPDWTPSPKAQATKPKPPTGNIPTMQAYHALRDALDKNGNGAVLPTHANMVLILKRDPLLNGLVQFNSFTGLHMLRKPVPVLDKAVRCSPGPYPRPWDADDITRLLAHVQKSWAHNFKKATVEECLLLEGRDNEVHVVRDYLDGLQWDGTKRLDLWLTMTFGCPSDDYHKAVGSKLLIAAVRRVRKPGCKYDQLVVLEGPQDIGKSTAILILFGADWSTDRISDLSSKDAAIDLRGKWGVELPEIEHLIKADVETVKAFLSRATDHYRPPYGRVAVDVPRQSVLIGTTNATEYLRDATGNRRVWPVKCLSAVGVGADLDWLRANRDQLWAEAAQREANAETIWLDNIATNTVAIQAQAARLAEDPWHDKVRDYIQGLKMTTVPDLFDHVLYVPTERQTKSLEMRVAAILKSLGWDKKLQWDSVTKKPFKAWLPPVDGG